MYILFEHVLIRLKAGEIATLKCCRTVVVSDISHHTCPITSSDASSCFMELMRHLYSKNFWHMAVSSPPKVWWGGGGANASHPKSVNTDTPYMQVEMQAMHRK